MKKSLFALGLLLGLGSTLFAAEKKILEVWDFSDPTTFHARYAKAVTKYKNVKAYSSRGYPMLLFMLERETDQPMKVLIRAAADPAVKPMARIGLLIQVQNPETKKYLQSGMQIRQLTDKFVDYVFQIDPAKLNKDYKHYRLCIYCFGRKGKPYLEKVQLFTDK